MTHEDLLYTLVLLAGAWCDLEGEERTLMQEIVAYAKKVRIRPRGDYRKFWIWEDEGDYWHEIIIAHSFPVKIYVDGILIFSDFYEEKDPVKLEALRERFTDRKPSPTVDAVRRDLGGEVRPLLFQVQEEQMKVVSVQPKDWILRFLEWLYQVVQRSVDEICAGTYQKKIVDQLPYQLHSGFLNQEDLPEGIPLLEGYRDHADFPAEHAKAFLARKDFRIAFDWKKMDLRQIVYFNYLGYRACADYDADVKAALDAYPDPWDFFLNYVAGERKEIFQLYDYRSGKNQDINGLPSDGLTGYVGVNPDIPVTLALGKDEAGFYFVLSWNYPGAQGDAILFYHALAEKGVLATFEYEYEYSAKKWLRKESQIGVLPAGGSREDANRLFRKSHDFCALIRMPENPNLAKELLAKMEFEEGPVEYQPFYGFKREGE